MKQSPMYEAWCEVAPDPDALPSLMEHRSARASAVDRSEEIRGLRAQTLLVYRDADSVPLTHAAEFFALLGEGLQDSGWDGSARSEAVSVCLQG